MPIPAGSERSGACQEVDFFPELNNNPYMKVAILVLLWLLLLVFCWPLGLLAPGPRATLMVVIHSLAVGVLGHRGGVSGDQDAAVSAGQIVGIPSRAIMPTHEF